MKLFDKQSAKLGENYRDKTRIYKNLVGEFSSQSDVHSFSCIQCVYS